MATSARSLLTISRAAASSRSSSAIPPNLATKASRGGICDSDAGKTFRRAQPWYGARWAA